MTKKLAGMALILALAGAGWWAVGAFWPGGPDSSQAKAGAERKVAVEAAPVTVGPIAREIVAVGTLRASESVIIRPEVAGRIKSFGFEEGAAVAKGQVLVKLDDATQAADLDQARANLGLSKANAERADRLAKQGAGTERARDEADAKLRVDQSRIEQARALLDKTQMVAPFAGVIGLRQVSVGAYVQPGQDIVNLEAIDLIKVDFKVPEIFLAAVRTGQKLSMTADPFPGREFLGEVYAINPAVDAQGRAVELRARLSNSDGLLRPGQFVRLTLKADEVERAIQVPEEAIVPVGSVMTVYRVVDGTAQRTPVKIGKRRQGKVEITEGLAESDVVITAGQMKLRPGAPVSIAAAPPPPGQ